MAKKKISQKWLKIIQSLPDYDPLIGADDFWFDEDEAQASIDFFAEFITHTKGGMAGKPYILEPHEEALTANIFGWKDNNGNRRYREVLYYVPRKNSKTTWAAGTSLQVLFTDGEPGAECYCAAADREQASLLYQQVEQMIHNCPLLEEKVIMYATTKTTRYCEENSFFKAISAEANTKHGFNSHLVIVDELHAQPNGELTDVLETSMGSRTQPLLIYITTSDYERPGSVCNMKHDYAKRVQGDPSIDPRFLPAIWEASVENDWQDPEVWKKANPNLGKSVSMDYFERMCKKAVEIPSFENTFKRLHLNIRTEQDVRWIPVAKWDACLAEDGYTPEDMLNRKCYMGIDISSKVDLSSLALFFPGESDFKHRILCYNWMPRDNALLKERETKVPYTLWARNPRYPHQLTLTDGDVIDQEVVRNKIHELATQYEVLAIGFDPWNAAQLGGELLRDGLPVFEYRQTFASMSPPTRELEEMILTRKLEQDGSPILRAAISNIAAELDGNDNVKLNKKKSTGRIDPIVASINAIGLWLSAELEEESIYNERGLICL